MKTKINIGCGDKHKEGFLNVDISPEVKPDMIVDLEKPLPFKDNSFEHIYSEHTLEHIRPDYFNQLIKEIFRIAKPNCILELVLPNDNSSNRSCIFHYRTFNYSSFDVLKNKNNDAEYFVGGRLERVEDKPNKLTRIFYQVFPYLLKEVKFKFKIIK